MEKNIEKNVLHTAEQMDTQTETPVKIVMKMDCGCNQRNGRDRVETGATGAQNIQNLKTIVTGPILR